MPIYFYLDVQDATVRQRRGDDVCTVRDRGAGPTLRLRIIISGVEPPSQTTVHYDGNDGDARLMRWIWIGEQADVESGSFEGHF